MENKKLKRIESKEEYYIKLKEYKKKMGRLFRKGFRHLGTPHIFIDGFENLMSEMVFIGLVSEEYAHSQRMRLYREMNQPSEFKYWVEESLKNIKKKLSPKRQKEVEEEYRKSINKK